MTFRTKLLLVFVLTVVVAVVLVGAIVSAATRRAFERLDAQRVTALVAQFQQELARRKHDIARQVKDIADADTTLAMAIDISRTDADPSAHVDDARPLAAAHNLDYLELVSSDGSIVSSGAMARALSLSGGLGPAPGRLELARAVPQARGTPSETALALVCVRVASVARSKDVRHRRRSARPRVPVVVRAARRHARAALSRSAIGDWRIGTGAAKPLRSRR